MSRIGKQPIPIPSGVEVTIAGSEVKVKGPKGELSGRFDRDMKLERDGETVVVTRPTDEQRHRALHGLTRSLVANMVTGVFAGFSKTLEIEGVGYRAVLKGNDLELALGYSHPVPYPAPAGITFEVPAPNRIIISGIDKQQVGQVAAEIRSKRGPEPYKGKGIRYQGEYVRRKVGKTAK
jgi:large subunit ribosomal protein L6